MLKLKTQMLKLQFKAETFNALSFMLQFLVLRFKLLVSYIPGIFKSPAIAFILSAA